MLDRSITHKRKYGTVDFMNINNKYFRNILTSHGTLENMHFTSTGFVIMISRLTNFKYIYQISMKLTMV